MKKIFLTFLTFVFYFSSFTNVYAASAQEKWNNARNQEIRNTIGQNATYGNNSGRITVRNYDATKKMVEASLSRSATVNGSKASVEAAVKVPVNMGKVAATTAKRLARGGVAGMLGGAAFQLLLDGAGWVMDPANNSIKMPNPDIPGQYMYGVADSLKANTPYGACQKQDAANAGGWQGKITLDSSRGEYGYCTAERYPQGWSITRYINPDYNPDNPDNFKPVSNDDLADALQKGADAGDPAVQQLIKDAYQAVDALGNATKDLGAAVDGLNDAVKDLTDAFDKIVKSDDPVATGNTDSVPTITTGGETSGDTDTQNKDKDGNDTGSSNSTSNFQLPAFCDWAATMCEWYGKWKTADQRDADFQDKVTEHYSDEKSFWEKVTDFFDWFKEDSQPDNDDTEVEIEEDDAPQLDTNIFNASGECPPDFTYAFPLPMGGTHTISYSYATVCYWFSKLYYIVVTVASLISIRIVSGTEGKSNG